MGFRVFGQKIVNKLLSICENILLGSLFSWWIVRSVARFILGIQISLYQKRSIGALWTVPNFNVLSAANWGLTHNLNQLGNPFAIAKPELNISRKIELQVIEWVKNAFRVKSPQDWEGYVTSGGTESNLFLAWLGRSYLRAQRVENYFLFHTSLTHYSVTKAARILDIPCEAVPIDSDYRMSLSHLSKKVTQLMSVTKGKVGVLLVLTIGYSATGTVDPVQQIIKRVAKLKIKYPDFVPYIWIDASMHGLPFLYADQDENSVLNSKDVFGICLDFHKLGSTPLPSGTVTYRGTLRELIEKPIDYLTETDATILGSRPGFAIISVWESLVTKGEKDRKREFLNLLERKKQWLSDFALAELPFTSITDPRTLTCALIPQSGVSIQASTIDKYSLNLSKSQILVKSSTRQLVYYKVHFFSDSVWDFLSDLKKQFSEKKLE